jgi:hypothetical protein
MTDVTFEEVLKLAAQLAPVERKLLAMRLEESIPETERDKTFREAMIAEHEQLRTAGAFDHTGSLFGKYASPNVTWNADELDSFLHQIGTEWESEMDELTDDDTATTATH